MEGHRFEAHVAAASRADREDNQDPAVGAAGLGKAIDTENRDQTTQRMPRDKDRIHHMPPSKT